MSAPWTSDVTGPDLNYSNIEQTREWEAQRVAAGHGARFEVFHCGVFLAAVCTNAGEADVIGERLNALRPTGISSCWTPVSATEPFTPGARPFSIPCPERQGCHHYVFQC